MTDVLKDDDNARKENVEEQDPLGYFEDLVVHITKPSPPNIVSEEPPLDETDPSILAHTTSTTGDLSRLLYLYVRDASTSHVIAHTVSKPLHSH